MTLPPTTEGLLLLASELPRGELVEMLRSVPCPFPIDFTDEYLNGLSVERLRHLVVAVCLQVRKGDMDLQETGGSAHAA